MNDYKTIYDAIQASKGSSKYVVPDGAVDLGLPFLISEKMYGATEIGGLGTKTFFAEDPRLIYVSSNSSEIVDVSPWRVPNYWELRALKNALENTPNAYTVENNKVTISLNGNELIIPVSYNFYAIDNSTDGYVTIWRIDQYGLQIGHDESYPNYLFFVCDAPNYKERWEALNS